MILPEMPLYTNVPVKDLQLLISYVSDLRAALAELDTFILTQPVQGGYAISGSVDRTLAAGVDTLLATQNTLTTLIADLQAKGIIGGV